MSGGFDAEHSDAEPIRDGLDAGQGRSGEEYESGGGDLMARGRSEGERLSPNAERGTLETVRGDRGRSLGLVPGLRVIRLEEFEEPCGMSQEERAVYRRRFRTLFVDEEGSRRGGLGRVMRATNAMGEIFALKVLQAPCFSYAADEAAREAHGERVRAAFRKEYEAHRSLSGFKGFPRLYGYAQVDGAPAIVMEWVEGITLDQARRELAVDAETRMAPLDAARLGRDLFSLLTRLDLVGEGFVHRDISPSNVMVRTGRLSVSEQAAEGAFDLCLIDFGSSVPLDPAQDPKFTSTYASARRATAAYAAPEMLSNDIPHVTRLRKSAAIDVYAAASVLYELVGGALPFDVAEDGETSPYRVKMDEKPARLVSAHAPSADMAQLLPCEPEVAFAVAQAMQEMGSDMDPADAQRALALVDEQLAELIGACLNPGQDRRPSAQAMYESLTAFCVNYMRNVARSIRGERLLPCTAQASWRDSLSPYAVNRVVNSVGHAFALALLTGVTVVTSVLLDGVSASWSVGPLHWEGELAAPAVAAVLLLPAVCGFAARAVSRKRNRGGVLSASISIGVSVLMLGSVLGRLSLRGMPELEAVYAPLFATAAAAWLPIVLEYATTVVPALVAEALRALPEGTGGEAAFALEADSVRSSAYIESSDDIAECEEATDAVDPQ